MRIIGGYAAGIQLKSPPAGVKPTMDRVREAIFASLEPLCGLTVVDLFAGSGALGLEACSRGAARIAWVEHQPRHVRIINENLERLRRALTEVPQMQVFQADVLMTPKLLAAWRPDIILADPPYNPRPDQKGSVELLSDKDFHAWAGDALLIIEQSKHNPLPPACLELWQITRHRAYGNNLVYHLQPNFPASQEQA